MCVLWFWDMIQTFCFPSLKLFQISFEDLKKASRLSQALQRFREIKEKQ